MSEEKSRRLQAARIEVAVQICIANPALYPKLTSRCPHFKSERERLQAETLVNLMRLEPSIRHILDFHYKRGR